MVNLHLSTPLIKPNFVILREKREVCILRGNDIQNGKTVFEHQFWQFYFEVFRGVRAVYRFNQFLSVVTQFLPTCMRYARTVRTKLHGEWRVKWTVQERRMIHLPYSTADIITYILAIFCRNSEIFKIHLVTSLSYPFCIFSLTHFFLWRDRLS